MKRPSRKQMIQWFGWSVCTIVDRAPDLAQGKPASHPNCTPYTSYENSDKPRCGPHFLAWKTMNPEKILGLFGVQMENDHAIKDDSKNITDPYKL